MASKVKPTAADAGAFFAAPFASTESLGAVNAAMSQAAERGVTVMEAGLAGWAKEAQRFYDEMSAQSAEVLEQLKGCKSPLDVLSVEQAWLAARSKSYLDTGLRFAQAFATVAQDLKAPASATTAAPTPPPSAA
jgi:hypothetical protein